LAIGFAAGGARVGLLARSKAELDLAHLEIEHAGGTSQRLRADVRDYEQIVSAVDRLTVQYGGVHVLICAHAILGAIGPLAAADPVCWAEAAATNLAGTMKVCRAVLPGMMQRRSGKIILLVGPGGESPRPNFSAYAATQSGLVRFAETLAEEVRESNVQVNCMHPGATYTSLTDDILAAGERAGEKELRDAAHLRTTGGASVEKQMQLAEFLASERSNHISGKLITIHDDLRKLETANTHSELFTLRRTQKV
jgi:3-oxoacyl-[acyl-carrier protein] reductase